MLSVGLAEDAETRFDISNYDLERPLLYWKNENVIGLMNDELGEKIIKIIVGLREKSYSYLTDDNSEDKKAKGANVCVMKSKLKFENYNNCLETTQFENKINHLQKNETDVGSLKKQ